MRYACLLYFDPGDVVVRALWPTIVRSTVDGARRRKQR
jgi:hypothetical protein